MRVVRGRAPTIDADARVTTALLDAAVDRGERAVRVWRPHRQVALGPRDAVDERSAEAAARAEAAGYPPVERQVGGRPVAYTGSTVAFARCEPVATPRTGVQRRYAAAVTDLESALTELGVDAGRGEPPDAFCPGSHSLAVGGTTPHSAGRKVAGIAQRVRADAALVAGVVVVRDHRAIAEVLAPVYDALDLAFDPGTVGSLARAGGTADPAVAVAAIESALGGEESRTVEAADAVVARARRHGD